MFDFDTLPVVDQLGGLEANGQGYENDDKGQGERRRGLGAAREADGGRGKVVFGARQHFGEFGNCPRNQFRRLLSRHVNLCLVGIDELVDLGVVLDSLLNFWDGTVLGQVVSLVRTIFVENWRRRGSEYDLPLVFGARPKQRKS